MDSDTNKPGINALARAYELLNLAPELLRLVKNHVNCPSWDLAKAVVEFERQLAARDADMDVIEAMHTRLLRASQ